MKTFDIKTGKQYRFKVKGTSTERRWGNSTTKILDNQLFELIKTHGPVNMPSSYRFRIVDPDIVAKWGGSEVEISHDSRLEIVCTLVCKHGRSL
jgi:hypothetical protein